MPTETEAPPIVQMTGITIRFPGVLALDGVHDGMQALVDGKINFIVECNPLLGDLAAGLVNDVLAEKSVEKKVYVEDQSFTQEQAAEVIDSRLY